MNRQVKRNIERFPDDFMFRLTKTEWDLLKCHFGISKEKGGDRALPNAFTEQGISMLSGLLRSEVAIKMNILIMRTFVAMRHFVTANAGLFQRVESLERQQMFFDEKIVGILNKIEELNPAPPTERLFSSGCVWDAWSFLSELIRNAKRRVFLIDNFVDERTLSLLDKREDDVQCTVYTRYNAQTNTDFEKHNAQYAPINRVQLSKAVHDRYLIVDDDVWLLGASVKDMGRGLCTVIKIGFSPEEVIGRVERFKF